MKNSGETGSLILPYGVDKKDVKHIVVKSSGATFPNDSSYLFFKFDQLQSVNLINADTSNVTNMNGLFDSCSLLTTVRTRGINTDSVTSMDSTFRNCSSLTTLDLSGFNTGSVTTMQKMFAGCTSLPAVDLSGFNTEKVSTMAAMFKDCRELTSLDLTGFDTADVNNTGEMFMNCLSLTTLDLSSFDLSSLSYVNDMFKMEGDSALTTIYAGRSWSMGDNESSQMFKGCTNLMGGAGTVYSRDRISEQFAKLDGGVSDPGYLSKYSLTVDAGEGGKVEIQDGADSIFPGDTVTLKTTVNAWYTLDYLAVRDDNGKKIEVLNDQFVMPYSNVTITAVFNEDALENKSTISSEDILLGQSVTITAAADGNDGKYNYAVYYKKSDPDAERILIQDFSGNDEIKFTPEEAGSYELLVVAKNSLGDTDEKTFNITVTGPLENTSTLESDTICLSQDVVVHASATGGRTRAGWRWRRSSAATP